MAWIVRLFLAVVLVGAAAGCDSGSHDDHKGHNHKPGEKH